MMPFACAQPSPDLPLALRMASYVDCHAHSLATNGSRALVSGALGPDVLSGLLIIFVAILGYRLLLGDRPSIQTGTLWAMRMGIVMALASASPAYDTLVYSVAVGAPTEIGNDLLPAADIAGADTMLVRLQRAYDFISADRAPSPAAPPAEGRATGPQTVEPAIDMAEIARKSAGVLLLATSLGSWLAIRVVMALLLAIGPLPILSLLFNSTRGLFIGWVRTLLGTILGSVAVTAVLVMEINLLEVQLSQSDAGGPAIAIISAFAVILVAVMAACARMVRGLHIPSALPSEVAALVRNIPVLDRSMMPPEAMEGVPRHPARSRAQSVADAVVALGRRDMALPADHLGRRDVVTGGGYLQKQALAEAGPGHSPGTGTSRRRGVRASGSAARRDAP